MTSLVDAATRAGYQVVSHNSPTCLEISGDGQWSTLEKVCKRFVRALHQGHPVDHVTIVMRHGDGTRDLRDVGTGGVRFGVLPSVGCVPVRRGVQGMWGVRRMYRRFSAQLTAHGEKIYLGTFATPKEAAVARDNYVCEHGLLVPLNYPREAVA